MSAPDYLIVDTCSYLRLGAHVHPHFWGGHTHFELRCIPQTDPELQNPRIRSTRQWASRDPHPALRRKWRLQVSAKELATINGSKQELLELAEEILEPVIEHRRKFDSNGDELSFLSPVDLTLLGHAFHFRYGLLTDELALRLVAEHLHLKVRTSLQMLKYFHQQQLINADRVDKAILRWHADDDLPNLAWASDFKRLFRRNPPKLP